MTKFRTVAVAIVLIAAPLLVTARASAHQDYSLAPNGVSPFLYNQTFTLCGYWYGEGTHRDVVSGQHYNDHHALDLCPTGGASGKAAFAIWNGLKVYAVNRSTGLLDMRGNVGGRYHRLTYRHLDQIFVNPGQVVGTNTRVGTVGSRGNSTGPHLHMSVHVLGGDGLFYSRRPRICGIEIPHDHRRTFRSC